MNYALGTTDPSITPDAGAGVWNSEPKTAEMIGMKLFIINHLPHAYAVIGDDAASNMSHYLGNSGSDHGVDVADMIADVPSARRRFDQELQAAKQFVETLAPGTYDITSQSAENAYNRKAESWNWFFAIGGYSTWGKGRATVSTVSGRPSYRLEFVYKFYDRYNWDGGKSVTLFGVTITDEYMGRFHRQGLAKEYDCRGAIHRVATWGASAAPAPAPGVTPPSPPPPPAPAVAPPAPSPPPTAPPNPFPPAGKRVHIVRPGDSLWKIAQRYYGDGNQWRRIHAGNQAVIGANPNLIVAGQRLVIP